jgi:hypothetical protein
LFIDGSFDERATHELARSKGQQERGHVSGTASASEKYLIFLRNLVSRTRANASRVRFVRKFGRAVSGNPAEAGRPAAA